MGLFGKIFGSNPAPAISTGRVMDVVSLKGDVGLFGSFGDTTYAEANSHWLLTTFADDFKAELFGLGVTKWDTRFDCNHFATFFAALAQTKFYAANFQSWTTAQTLAVGELWYRPHGSTTGHAIVIVMTEAGRMFIEPQTCQPVQLTPDEWASRFLVKF